MKRSFRLSDSAPDARRDVADELRFHLDMRTKEFEERGMSPEDARRAAVASFGDPEAVAAECRTVREDRGRERRVREWAGDVMADGRLALRALRRSPAFSVAALLTFALGIGAAAAVFTVVNGVLLRPMPYARPDRIVMVWTTGENGAIAQWPHSAGSYEDVRVQSKALEHLAAFRAWGYALQTTGGETELLAGSRVTPDLFTTLGVRPLLGRALTESDAAPGAPRVAIIGYDLWTRRFGASPAVLGRAVTLGGERFTVVGVMPRGFAFPRGSELPSGFGFRPRTEMWTPLAFTPQDLANRGTLNLAVVGRLRDGVTPTQAKADVDIIAARLRVENPQTFPENMGLRVVTLKEQAVAPARRGLLLFMGAVGMVLLVACANVANLLVARSAARAREFAVRRALGASSARLVRQLVTENVVLAVLGAALGLVFAAWASAAAMAVVPGDLPRADDVHVDLRVVSLTLLAALAAGAAFGLAAAAGASRSGSLAELQGSRAVGSPARRFGRRTLVAVEVALSLVLLVGAALLGMSFARLQQVDAGFQPEGVMSAGLLMPIAGGFDPARDGPTWRRLHGEYAERLRHLPNVAAAGAVSSLPLTGANEGTTFSIVGRAPLPPGKRPRADYAVVAPGYFSTMRIPLVEGRDFDSREGADGPWAVIVSEALAKENWPGESAIGKRIDTGIFQTREWDIIGVAKDVRLTALDAPSRPALYYSVAQLPYPYLSYVVRAKQGDPAALLPAMRRELAALDPALALFDAKTMES
ncbi:MAG: ADOP family duplicated permease, partial [Gemmatimonadaceae bacterium]